MKPNPWALLALVVLAVQISPLLKTVSAQSGNFVLPHAVQGPGATSPLVGNTVTVRGVVTAQAADGFFIQTESNLQDNEPNTSEGLFVAETDLPFGRGTIVHVTGTVEEFNDVGAGTVTRLVGVTEVAPNGNADPADPILLTNLELSPDGSSDQLERFEGMRVMVASLRSVSGMSRDGSFYAVLHDAESNDAARPFRGPGIEAGAPALDCAIGPCAFEQFDGNPERLRVDSDSLVGTMAPQFLSTGATMDNVDGVLHFEMGAHTLLPRNTLSPSSGMTMRAVRPTNVAEEYSIASLNLGDASIDDEIRLMKASLMVRTMLNAPDIIGVQQADAALLEALAAQIDMDASEADEAEPGYVAHLHGFLVKASRVTEVSAEVVGGDALFQGGPLFDRAPVMLRGLVTGGLLPQPVTVLNVELRSNLDVDRADDAGATVRAHRLAQAVRVAEFVRDRNDLNEALVVVGNFNAHAFNDGYVDVTGTVSGAPALPNQVVLESPDLVTGDLANLAGGLVDGERYSSVERGNAQSFDHTLVNGNLMAQVRGFEFARVNADFAEVLQFFDDNPGRLSDRDPSVAYFAYPADVTAPVFDVTPPDVVVDATGPAGATVNYTAPTATDNLDGAVPVTCAPLSGSLFPLGSTTVTCWAEDVIGNSAEVSFLVTVEDDNAPVLFVPPNITEEADSPAGRVVTYTVTATDAGTAAPTVVCQPASGSTFPIGTTTVNCQASDDAGNTSSASFTVTITNASAAGGRMYGAGLLRSGHKRAAFAFDVRQSSRSAERGWLVLTVNDGHGRPDWSCVAGVFEVRFSNPRGTVSFSGTGNWNGKRGYRFDVTATDGGGRHDKFAVVVTAPNGQVVLSLAGGVSLGRIKQTR